MFVLLRSWKTEFRGLTQRSLVQVGWSWNKLVRRHCVWNNQRVRVTISAVGRWRRNLFPWIERVRVWSVWKKNPETLARERGGRVRGWAKRKSGVFKNITKCRFGTGCILRFKTQIRISFQYESEAKSKANVLCQRVLSCHVLLAGPWLNGILKFHNCNFKKCWFLGGYPNRFQIGSSLPPTHVNPV